MFSVCPTNEKCPKDIFVSWLGISAVGLVTWHLLLNELDSKSWLGISPVGLVTWHLLLTELDSKNRLLELSWVFFPSEENKVIKPPLYSIEETVNPTIWSPLCIFTFPSRNIVSSFVSDFCTSVFLACAIFYAGHMDSEFAKQQNHDYRVCFVLVVG